MELSSARVVVTGGAGFLGRRVVARLEARGCTALTVPRSRDYDLRDRVAVQRLYRAARPERSTHLAAVVGGSGANGAHPGRFFHDNVVMGIETLEQARLGGGEKVGGVGPARA